MTTYTSEPGTRLGGRYRLEDRIAAGSGWAAWKAIDETLARAVTVFTFAQGFPRVTEVATAARAASRLTDPRLAQVFDVEDAWDRAYIVMEWAAGDTLADLVSQGPLEPARAARMIAEAAAALSSAHAAGVAHMCLSPGSVRWTQTGEVKVVGLGIDAALSGVSAEDPVATDTQGLGRLLYAGLTGYWPGPDYPSLPAAPTTDGQPCSPRQVLAGVPLAFSDLACRAMQLHSREGSPPLTMPGEFARELIAALPPLPIPPAPMPPAPAWQDSSDYPHGSGWRAQDQHWRAEDAPTSGWRPGARSPAGWSPEADGQAETDWSKDPIFVGRNARAQGESGFADEQWPADLPGGPNGIGRRGRRAGAGLPVRGRRAARRSGSRFSVGVIAAVGAFLLVTAVAAFTLWPSGSGPHGGPGTGQQTSPASAVTPLQPAGVSGFDPLTSPGSDPSNENAQWARYAIDSSMRTSWTTQWYRTAEFGGLKSGSGLIIDMGKAVRFSSVTVTFGSEPGAQVTLLAGDSAARSQANLRSMTTLASATSPTGAVTFQVKSSATSRFLVIWFSKLPHRPGHGHWYMGEIFNVSIRGIA